MIRPRVLLDCDGVLADFIDVALDIVGVVTGRTYQPEQVTQWDFCAALGLTSDEAAIVKRSIGAYPNLAAGLNLYPGVVDGVRALQEIAEVYIVTSPWNSNPTWCHDREAWLWKYFKIPSARVVHTSAKHLVVGDVLVDDKTSTLIDWQAAHPSKLAVQWSTPHNRSDGWDGASTSLWADLRELVCEEIRQARCECTGLAFGHAPFCPARGVAP